MADVDTKAIVNSFQAFVNELPGLAMRLAGSVLIILLGVVVLRIGRRIIRRVSAHRSKASPQDPEKDTLRGEPAGPAPSTEKTTRSLVTSIFNYVLYFAIAMAVLSMLGVDVSGLLAVAGVGGVAIGFGCQTLVKDVISGMFLWIDGYIKVGDIVSIGAFTGTVESVGLRTTKLRGTNGNMMFIPNGDIRTVINMTRDFRCALVDITVAHGQDYDRAIQVLRDAMKDLDDVSDLMDEPPTVQGIIASDRGAATIRIECKCDIRDCWTIERLIRLRALDAFRKAEIKP